MKDARSTKAEEYKQKIFEYLDKLPAGMVSVYKICKRETLPEFLKICQEYIKERGEINHYSVYLNNKKDTLHKFDKILHERYEK